MISLFFSLNESLLYDSLLSENENTAAIKMQM